ncbi:MAG: glycosyltransferase, partial [Methylococcales bacterium]|nr:glycosyltransferase [Methylococcales bacterium]
MIPPVARVSIIIPTYNEAAGIVVFLNKLQRLRPQCELILVDGGSNDNTLILAKSQVDYILQSAKGRAVQM